MRTFSVPERLGGFGALVALAATAWPAVTAGTWSLPCPLRTLTGIPCPACGLTTAAIAIVRGDLAGAFHANPLIFGLAAVTAATGPLVVLRAAGALKPPRPWSSPRRRQAGWIAGLLATASWLFQLHRLHTGPQL
ncbi:DUF2752 domain-containing protein [Actinoplanes sp. NPDC023936]|uniref:DUF2752 domain-containing protein n=1 Tax=Actinoplanes sp. NPDC023936 TaxID=3154910 RepID=UPI0033DF3FAF